MQSAKPTAKFFSEDLIYKSARDGKSQVGLVIGSCDSDSDDEQSESSSTAGRCKIAAGQAKVAWYPTGKTQVIDENKVKLLDRALLPGDVVQYTGRARQQQMGIVADGTVRLDLRVLGTNQVIRNVLWSDMESVSPVDEQVIILFKSWIGYVVENSFTVTLETADGSVLTMNDYDFLLLEDVSTERHDRCHFEEFPFVGQKVIARKKYLRYASWVSKTRTSHIYCSSQFPANFKILMTVRDVKLERLDVKWMYSVSEEKVMCSAHSSPLKPPPDTITGPDLQSVSQLNYFGKNSLQTGDRGYYAVKEEDVFVPYRDWQHAFTEEESQSECDEKKPDERKVPDSAATLRPHACSRKKEVTVSVKRIRRKKLRPAKRLDIRSRNASLIPGSRVAVEIISTDTLVRIVWQDGTEESDVPSNLFYPVQHVDSHEFFPGDFIVENRDEFSYDAYGVVQKVDHSGRTAVVKWFECNPNEPPKDKVVESVSVYDIKDHPDFQFRPGSCVIKIMLENVTDFEASASVGQVIRVHTSGQLECVWVNGCKQMVYPQELFHIGEYDSDDLWADSDSEQDEQIRVAVNDVASKEELLSQLMETINDLEGWFLNHETVNNRNAPHAMKMVMSVCKQMREVDGQFGDVTFSLNELKSLLDTTKPPESPSEITWARLANRVKGFLNVVPKSQENGDEAQSPLPLSSQEDCSKTESPNSVSKKTTASLEALRRIKTHLFPLCASFSPSDDQKQGDTIAAGTVATEEKQESGCSADKPPGNFRIEESVPDCHRFKLSVHHPHNPKLFCSKVRQEIALLKSSLPEDIVAKAYEDRMDLFSFMIKGPKATPYENGLFLFDVQLPADYPTHPPAVHYISFCTDRLNPNLYENGKVCVSLLGTWVGKGSEMWFPGSSNLLQVMVSIQGLILVPEPYFNEAGYLRQKGTDEGQENSRLYNEMAVVKVVQSLTKMLSLPPATFRAEVLEHIRETGPLLTERLAHWIQLSQDFNSGLAVASRDEAAQLTDFPLLPASLGFCLSLKKALSAFQNNMSKN